MTTSVKVGYVLLILCLVYEKTNAVDCTTVRCASGHKCVMQQVVCASPPCDSQAKCVPDPCLECKGLCTSEDTCGTPCVVKFECVNPPPATCAATTCLQGYVCVDYPTGAKCKPACLVNGCPKGEKCVKSIFSGYRCVSTCQIRKCSPGYICKDTVLGATCVKAKNCNELKCEAGNKCVRSIFFGVRCVATCQLVFCKPGSDCVETFLGAHCVERPQDCSSLTCLKGETCVQERVFCEKYPCLQPAPQCVPLCKAPADPGLCKAYIPSYFFNSTAGQCQKFIYGGCGGNDNRFKTLEECQKVCPSTCDNMDCPAGQICVQETIYCVKAPCPQPPPTCVTPKKPCLRSDGTYGQPLLNVFCGRGPNRQDCPKGYQCDVHPADAWAVCCSSD